jgi:hypothetical protein
MAELSNGTVWQSDASLDQRFAYISSERNGDNWNHYYGQDREFMYKYTSTNTLSNPGHPERFRPQPEPIRHLHLEMSRAECEHSWR